MTTPFSYSSMAAFMECPLRFKLRYVDGLEVRGAASNTHHLAWGSAFHAGLARLYRPIPGIGHGYAQFTNDLAREGLLSEARADFRVLYPMQLDPLDRAKTQLNGLHALDLYVKRWASEDVKWRVIEVEGPGAIADSDSGLDTIHTDLIAENTETGGIYVWDHKTTSKTLGPWYWDRYSPNSQITHYIDYCEQQYGSCEGFIINAVCLQWRDEKKANGANNVEWFNVDDPAQPWRVYSHYEERPYKGGPLGKAGARMCAWGLTVAFERQVFTRTKEQLVQQRRSTVYWRDQIEYAARRSALPDAGSLRSAAYGFNTGSCYSCEYRGGEVVGGICRPGLTWPEDQELILLSYRQVCREVILLQCAACRGTGVDDAHRKEIGRAILEYAALGIGDAQYGEYSFAVKRCPRCKGVGMVDGPRCALDRGHAGKHSPDAPPQEEDEMEVEVQV